MVEVLTIQVVSSLGKLGAPRTKRKTPNEVNELGLLPVGEEKNLTNTPGRGIIKRGVCEREKNFNNIKYLAVGYKPSVE